jgi:hypothetical protein
MADTHGVSGGPQGIRLADGTRLNELDAIVLAQSHVSARLTPQQERTASLAAGRPRRRRRARAGG